MDDWVSGWSGDPGAVADVDPAVMFAAMLARPAWHREANCLGMGSSLFFPSAGVDQGAAVAVCDGCPVRGVCAVAGVGELGVWGGLSASRRNGRSRRRPAIDRTAA